MAKVKVKTKPKRRGLRAGKRMEPWEPLASDMDVHRRWCEGDSQHDIARSMGVNQSGISKICTKVEKFLIARYIDDARGIKLRQTVRLEKYIRELEAAWERSKQDAVVITEKDVKVGESEMAGTETSTRTSGQCGNVAYLESAMGAMDRIRKIWGADAPVEHRVTGEVRVAGLPRDQAREAMLKAELEKISQRNLAQLTPSTN